MRQKFGKLFFLIPIGLFIMAATTVVSRFFEITDFVEGIAYGVGIGVTILPFLVKQSRPAALAD